MNTHKLWKKTIKKEIRNNKMIFNYWLIEVCFWQQSWKASVLQILNLRKCWQEATGWLLLWDVKIIRNKRHTYTESICKRIYYKHMPQSQSHFCNDFICVCITCVMYITYNINYIIIYKNKFKTFYWSKLKMWIEEHEIFS